jgi:hypothetical protein
LLFFKGEPAWGPRYLTPVLALAWVFVPSAATSMGSRRFFVGLILGIGMFIQLLALSMDPQRMFFEKPLSINYYNDDPWLSFHPAASHLIQRPREIVETLFSQRERAPQFSPASLPTHGGKLPPPALFNLASVAAQLANQQGMATSVSFKLNWEAGSTLRIKAMYIDTFQRYHIFHSFRPWWASQWYLSEDERPVDLVKTLVFLVILSAVGFGLMLASKR